MNYTPEQCKKIFQLTEQFLFKMIYDVTQNYDGVRKILNQYHLPNKAEKLTDIYERFCRNTFNMGNVDAKAVKKTFDNVNGWNELKKILFNFDPREVKKEYTDLKQLQNVIEEKFGSLAGEARPNFIKEVFNLAQFWGSYNDSNAVYNHFTDWRKNKSAREFRDELINLRVSNLQLTGREGYVFFGFGPALLSDALKEIIGYTDYVKVDTHIEYIAKKLGIVPDKGGIKEHHIFDGMIKFANDIGVVRDVEVTPYILDKYFYLIGSGNFDHHPEIRDKMSSDTVGRKQNFITFVKERLREDLEKNKQVALLVNDETNGLYRGQMGVIKEDIDYENWRVKISFSNHNNLSLEFYPSEFVILTE